MFREGTIEDKKAFKSRLEKLQLAGELIFSEQIFLALLPFNGQYIYHQQFLLFKEFVSLFQRGYEDNIEEFDKRFGVFQESLQRQAALNQKETDLNGTAKYGINKFSDWTSEEFKSLLSEKLTHFNKTIPVVNLVKAVEPTILNNPCAISMRNVPKKVDWRPLTTRIKNQKSCGSCWAFVGSEQVETYSAISGNKLLELSPQELVSCAPSLGCSGGNTCLALDWLATSGSPLVEEKVYPYEEQDSNCQISKLKSYGVKISTVCGCHRLVGDEDLMIQVLAQNGPLAVNVDAVSWHDYIGGVIQHHCSNLIMNHAVQLVGYNFENEDLPYYILRNQWGSSFGENGYLRVKYGSNICGVAEEPSFIII